MALNEGDKAPAFKGVTFSGEKISLSDFKGKTVVLYFYPKDMTPGCTTQACDFRDHQKELAKKKAAVIGVSKDSVELHEKFRDKYKLNFPLIADESGEICEAYGVIQEKNMYGKKYMGIVRSTFIIDEKGKIQKIFPKVKASGHIDEVLACL